MRGRKIRFIALLTILLLFAGFLLISNSALNGSGYLHFSDAAKYADIAKNLYRNKVFGLHFSFFGEGIQESIKAPLFYASGIMPLMPISIAISFALFGILDLSIIVTSTTFFLILVVATYLLGRKLFGELAGLLGAVTFAANQNFLEYSASGASEPLLALEVVLAAYLFLLRNKLGNILGFLMFVLLYFTRQQAFIYIAGLLLFWLCLRYPTKKVILYFLGTSGIALLIDLFVLKPLSGHFFLYSILGSGTNTITQNFPGVSSSETLRGVTQSAGVVIIFKKAFYNLYNFYRLLPQIASPYMWTLFTLGLFKWGKDKAENSLKISTIFMVALTFLVTALTIPLFRYLHPIVPLVYLFATATLVWVVRQFFKVRMTVVIISTLLIFLFVVGQTLGVIFLDSRFKAKTTNKGKPPVYVVLSKVLKENTDVNDVVVTNLDTWGSWYGERRTVWYPLKPEQLDLKDTQNPFDAIFLTNYLIDDENYYMGTEWRQIFENPKNPKDEFIAKNYKFAGEFKVSADETYEKQEGRAILLVRK